MEFWPGVTNQRGTLTRGHNSTWNFDPWSQFNVEFWPVCISSIRGIATQEGVKIQQRDQNSTAKEGHNSTKNPLNIDPGSVFNEGVKILSYTVTYKTEISLKVTLINQYLSQNISRTNGDVTTLSFVAFTEISYQNSSTLFKRTDCQWSIFCEMLNVKRVHIISI